MLSSDSRRTTMTAASNMGQNRRLVVVLYPFQGHINPMLQLATILHSKGFSITVVHPEFNSPDPSTHPNFTFVPIHDGLSELVFSAADFIAPVLALNRNCEAPFRQLLEEIKSSMESGQLLSGVVYDGFMHFAQKVADQLNVPGISVRTSAAVTLLAFSVFRSADYQGYKSFQDSFCNDDDQVEELQSLRVMKDLITSMTQNTTDTLLELRASVTDAMQSSSAIIVNTVHFLEQDILGKTQELFRAPIFPIGPFHKLAPSSSDSLLKEDNDCILWLDRQAPRSVLYISFGSMVKVDVKELHEIAEALSLSGVPFLWVVRPSSVDANPLPNDFMERVRETGRVVNWAPQREVLAHQSVGGFWSHCGWNSILESVSEGVPMICRPFVSDQKLNSRYVCDVWNVGLELGKEIEGEKVARVIRRLMVEKDGEDIRRRATQFKELSGSSLKVGGVSCSSMAQFVDHIVSVQIEDEKPN